MAPQKYDVQAKNYRALQQRAFFACDQRTYAVFFIVILFAHASFSPTIPNFFWIRHTLYNLQCIYKQLYTTAVFTRNICCLTECLNPASVNEYTDGS